MILHFLSDDKFSDYVISQFSESEMHSEFVLMSESENIKYFQNVCKSKRVNPYKKSELSSLISSLGKYSAIVLHGLFYPWCETVLRNVPEKVKVAWVFWGGEIYGRKDLRYSFLAPRTKVVCLAKDFKDNLTGKRRNQFELSKELFQRIDYCLTDMQEEYEFAKKYLETPDMKHSWYNYYSIDETVGKLKDKQSSSKGVFVGNSCTIECNYFDVFHELKRLVRDDRKVIAPLSYGSLWLKKKVYNYGKRCFGSRFSPLMDYLPLKDYNQILLSCSTMVQPQRRNQAQGNVITGLWLGMRVYLSEMNFAFPYFKRLGMNIFSVEHDLDKDPFAPLTQEEIDHNRKVLLGWYSRDVMRKQNLKLVRLLESLI